MKLKSIMLALAATFVMLLVNGCYTQLARHDGEEEEPEYTESEPAQEEEYAREDDVRRETHVYIYDYPDYYSYRYGSWWDPWDPWYRYPSTRWYLNIGYGYYDPYCYDPYWSPGWCGAGWNPWWGGSYWHSPWSRPVYVYYPVYDPYPSGRGSSPPEKRPFGRRSSDTDRRGTTTTADNGAIAKRGSLSKPDGSIYVRGEDGSYRRERRRTAEPVAPTPTGSGNDERASDQRRVVRRDPVDASGGAAVATPSAPGASAVAKPVSAPETKREPAARRSREDGDKKSGVERRSRPTEKVSRPAREDGASRRSSNDNSSSSRPSYSGNSGASSSSGGHSSAGSSSSGRSSSSGSSSSGSSRRSKN